jgi:hypothetical protein
MSKVNLTPEQAQFRQGVFAIVLGVLALAGCAWFLGESMENLRSAGWPRTAGTIESFRVVQQVKARSGVQYLVETRYSFTVGGVVHHGDRFNTRGNYLAGEGAASQVAGSYRAGGPCTVAYDPSNPDRCFLDTTITWHTWGKCVLGGIAGVGGLLLLYFGLRNTFWGRRKQTEP